MEDDPQQIMEEEHSHEISDKDYKEDLGVEIKTLLEQ